MTDVNHLRGLKKYLHRASLTRVQESAEEQLRHANLHGWTASGWVVGVNALDGEHDMGLSGKVEVRTEEVETFMGLPVRRSLELPREAIWMERGPDRQAP